MNLFTIDELDVFNRFRKIINKRSKLSKTFLLDEISQPIYNEYQKETCPGHDRRYHDFNHIIECISILDFVATLYDMSDLEYDMLLVAIIYHDIVYVTDNILSSANNEGFSASFASSDLKNLGLPSYFIQEVSNLILATMHIDDMYNSSFLQLVIRDIDLHGLASDWNKFNKSSKNIRHEYGCTEESLYINGRIRFISDFLDRKSLYGCWKLKDLWEDTARSNLSRHLDNLKSTI